MNDDDRATLAVLRDRAEIHDVLLRYAAAVDRRDEAAIAACLAPQFHAHYGPIHLEHRDMFLDFLRSRPAVRASMHMFSNHYVAIDGDQAWADTYGLVSQLAPDSDDPARLSMTGCRYHDRLVRVDGRWLFAERGGPPRWASDGLASLTASDAAARWLLDRAQLADLRFSYALGVDLHQFDRFRDVFAPEFVARFGPMEYSDIEEFIEFIRSTRQYFLSTQHFFASPYIEVDGDRAHMQTYAMITHRAQRDEGVHVDTGANNPGYIDHAVRHGSGWRIAEADFATPPPTAEPRPLPPTDDPTVRELVDRAAIADVMARYALGVDRRDAALVDACFAPEAGAVAKTAIADAEQWPQTTHFTGNRLIELDGDAASCQTYVYVSHRTDLSSYNEPSDWASNAVVYRDRLARQGVGWVITEREVSPLR